MSNKLFNMKVWEMCGKAYLKGRCLEYCCKTNMKGIKNTITMIQEKK